MATVKPPDETATAPAVQASQSDQPLMEERKTIISEYASYLREILKRLRKRSN
jgi:hypothetical protein